MYSKPIGPSPRRSLQIRILGVLALLAWLIASAALPGRAGKPASRPSLFIDGERIEQIQRNVKRGGIAADACVVLLEEAEKHLQLPTTPFQPDPQHPALKDGSSGRAVQRVVQELALAGYLSGEEKYLDKAVEVLMAVCEQWPIDVYSKALSHLQVGDAAMGLAIGYDWLYPRLTPGQRETARQTVEDYGQWLFDDSRGLHGIHLVAMGSMIRSRLAHNHGAVVHGPTVLCALALGGHQDWIDYGMERVRGYLEYSLDDTGMGYEGVMYSNYGLHATLLPAVAYEQATGENVLDDYPALRQVARAIAYQIVPWGSEVVVLNQSAKLPRPGGALFHLINRYEDGVGLWGWERLMGSLGDGTHGAGHHQGATTLPYVLIFSDPRLRPMHPEEAGLALSREFEQGVFIARTGWDEEDALMSFRSAEAIPGIWNHPDANSFTFYAYGEGFAIDSAAHNYATSFHNTILVDGRGQAWRGPGNATYARIYTAMERGDSAYAMGDATKAYVSNTFNETDGSGMDIVKAQRRIFLGREPRPFLVIMDDYAMRDNEVHEYTWQMTSGNIHLGANELEILEEPGRARITGHRRGAVCDIHFLHPGIVMLAQEKRTRYKLPTLTAKTMAINPYFVTVLAPSDVGQEPVGVSATGSPANSDMVIDLDFGPEGKRRVYLMRGGIFYEEDLLPGELQKKE